VFGRDGGSIRKRSRNMTHLHSASDISKQSNLFHPMA
jgi:hypothetical protein